MPCLFTVIYFCYLFSIQTEPTLDNLSLNPPFYTNTVWVDSVMQVLTTDQRIAQLFMVAAYSNKGGYKESISRLIKEYHIGGLMFMQGGLLDKLV